MKHGKDQKTTEDRGEWENKGCWKREVNEKEQKKVGKKEQTKAL